MAEAKLKELETTVALLEGELKEEVDRNIRLKNETPKFTENGHQERKVRSSSNYIIVCLKILPI